MNIKISTEEDKVIVLASLSLYDPRNNPRRSIDTAMIENHLREKGIYFGNCIQSTFLNNGDKDSLTGTWIFEGEINVLDKTDEDVILIAGKEEKSASKTKSSAKKKTAKK